MAQSLAEGLQMKGDVRGDDDLIRAFRDDADEASFALLVERYRDRVFRLALSVLGPQGRIEAEDVTQEVFILVHRKLDTFRSESRFSSWLYRVAQRRALELRRRARYRHPHTHDPILEALPTTEGESGLASRENRLALYAAVEALREPSRSTVYLHYWLGESIANIAELKGRRPGSIKAQLHRARKQLARMLEATQ